MILGEIFAKLRQSLALTDVDCQNLLEVTLTPERKCAVIAGLGLRDLLSGDERHLLSILVHEQPELIAYLDLDRHGVAGSTAQKPRAQFRTHFRDVFKALIAGQPLSATALHDVLKDIVTSAEVQGLSAALLMAICVKGMRPDDVLSLTRLMADSGQRFDYRACQELLGRHLISRYPTGALSEKTALILPALLVTAQARVPVATPFLVAKSLAHTGGTWDKLSAIPGFHFPEPGDETIRTLLSCGAAMIVTHANINPADRKLYQLRSATGTVESIPLIVSSIASKQLCVPLHRLLLDVRVGDSAFLRTDADARDVGSQVTRILQANGTACSYTTTATPQPNGMAIGNALEVAEAIAVMGGPREIEWDERALIEQKLIVIDFFVKLMAAEFSSISNSDWAQFAVQQFQSGAVLRAFETLLRAHRVDEAVIALLFQKPLSALRVPSVAGVCRSQTDGTLRRVSQHKLGEGVNRVLGGGGNEFEGRFDPTCGVILSKRIGDIVRTGDVLAAVYTERAVDDALLASLLSCFEVE